MLKPRTIAVGALLAVTLAIAVVATAAQARGWDYCVNYGRGCPGDFRSRGYVVQQPQFVWRTWRCGTIHRWTPYGWQNIPDYCSGWMRVR